MEGLCCYDKKYQTKEAIKSDKWDQRKRKASAFCSSQGHWCSIRRTSVMILPCSTNNYCITLPQMVQLWEALESEAARGIAPTLQEQLQISSFALQGKRAAKAVWEDKVSSSWNHLWGTACCQQEALTFPQEFTAGQSSALTQTY